MSAEWSRLAWKSPLVRSIWEPRLRAVSNAWLNVELESVTRGLRQAALVFGEQRVKASGLTAVSVGSDRFAVGPGARTLADAYKRADNGAVGAVLGFPACCCEFFTRTWGAGLRDTTFEMADADRLQHYETPIECNILGRWAGVRLVPHLPCSWTCEHTVELALAWRGVWPAQELRWAEEMLSWPFTWTARHGIAIVENPAWRISAGTTIADGLREVKRPVSDDWFWLANGFSSDDAMNAAHHMVMAVARQSPPTGTILDLGCGNGRLMRAIGEEHHVASVGIECDPTRVDWLLNAMGNAFVMGGSVASSVSVKDLNDHDAINGQFDTIIASARRFEEIPTLRQWARSHCRQLIEYSYDAPQFARVVASEQ